MFNFSRVKKAKIIVKIDIDIILLMKFFDKDSQRILDKTIGEMECPSGVAIKMRVKIVLGIRQCQLKNLIFVLPSLPINAIKLRFFVGWVEQSETHQTFEIYNNGGFRFRSTHPTISLNLMALSLPIDFANRKALMSIIPL